MKVALYVRKSTDEQVDSIETQRENALRWVNARGEQVVATFEDSGISRAEFARERRPGIYRLLDEARAGSFDAIVCRDLSRLGGDVFRTGSFIQDIHAAGARLFNYADGSEVTAANALQCMMLAFQLFGAHDEREKISGRTREALFTKARAGRVAGGIVFGYINREVLGPDGKRAYVVRETNPAQADVVRDIFQRYARGEGLKTIAKQLNMRGVPSPRATKGGLASWAPSTIREILRHELYRGRVVYGVRKKGYSGGTRVRTARAAEDIVSLDAPNLRIIDDALWAAAHARMGTTASGAPRAKTVRGRPAVNLLSNILRCGKCCSPMRVVNTKVGAVNEPAYMCTAHQLKKRLPFYPDGCPNSLRRPVAEVNAVVVAWLHQEVLREELVRDTLDEVRVRIEARLKARHATTPHLAKRAEKLRVEIDRFAEMALEAPADARPVFYEKVSQRRTELDSIEAELRATQHAPAAIDLEVRRMMSGARSRIADMRNVLATAPPSTARALLLKLFPDGILAFPMEYPNETGRGRRVMKRLLLDGTSTAAWPLLMYEGEAGETPPPKRASPAGFEPA